MKPTTQMTQWGPLDDSCIFHFGSPLPQSKQSSQPSSKEWSKFTCAGRSDIPCQWKYQAAICDSSWPYSMGRSLSPESWILKSRPIIVTEWRRQHFVNVKTFSGRPSISSSSFAAPNERWLFNHTVSHSSAPMPAMRTLIFLDIAWYCLSKGIHFSTSVPRRTGSIPFRPWTCALCCLIGPPLLDSDGITQAQPDASITLSNKDARDVLSRHPHGLPLSCMAHMYGVFALESGVRCTVLDGPSHEHLLGRIFSELADGYLWDNISLGG